jgi:L-lactate utilization protein LutB
MKSFLTLSIFYLLCSSLHPQANLILNEKNADELVNKQLQKALHKNYAERKKTVKIALQSIQNLQEYQQSCKQKYLDLLPSFSKSMKELYSY